MVYARDDFINKQLTKPKLPDDIEGVFIEVNLRKTKWLIFGTYRTLFQPGEYFFKHVDMLQTLTDKQKCEQIFLADDFIAEEIDSCLCEFLISNDSEILVQDTWISFSQTVWAVFTKQQ